jgi:hypothetical protein
MMYVKRVLEPTTVTNSHLIVKIYDRKNKFDVNDHFYVIMYSFVISSRNILINI